MNISSCHIKKVKINVRHVSTSKQTLVVLILLLCVKFYFKEFQLTEFNKVVTVLFKNELKIFYVIKSNTSLKLRLKNENILFKTAKIYKTFSNFFQVKTNILRENAKYLIFVKLNKVLIMFV